jgi:molecular chaperone GrpE (heat shock protein)
MKKDEKKIIEEQDDLEKKLEEVQKEKDEQGVAGRGTSDEKDVKIQQLEKELKEQMEISKRAQHDYINLKRDFDRYMQNMKEKSASLEVDTLISVVKKFLPFVENLRKSLATIADDQKESPFVK